MPKKRKGQGLSITTIIVAVIGLIILVVIIAILTGRLGIFSAGLESATSCDNTCTALNKEMSDPPDDNGNCAEGEFKASGNCCCKPIELAE
jgi:hypothetical protein